MSIYTQTWVGCDKCGDTLGPFNFADSIPAIARQARWLSISRVGSVVEEWLCPPCAARPPRLG